MSASAISEKTATVFAFVGTVHLYVERSGVMHAVHEGTCLKCGETENWITYDVPLTGTLTSPRTGATGYVTV